MYINSTVIDLNDHNNYMNYYTYCQNKIGTISVLCLKFIILEITNHFPSSHKALCNELCHRELDSIRLLFASQPPWVEPLFQQPESIRTRIGSRLLYHSAACRDLWRIQSFWFHFYKQQLSFYQISDWVMDLVSAARNQNEITNMPNAQHTAVNHFIRLNLL